VFCEALVVAVAVAVHPGGPGQRLLEWEISMRQVEGSRTIVFDAPRNCRAFFEALVVDNLDVGRPEQMQLVFGRRVRTDPVGGYLTRLLRTGDDVTLNANFRHSRVKSHLKEGRAFRIKTVINDPGDLGVARRLEHLDEISTRGRAVNRRMVTFRVGQGRVLASPAFERVPRPTEEDGRRALPDFAGSLRRHLYRQAERVAAYVTGHSTTWTGLSWR
jgi:hypothetical protein